MTKPDVLAGHGELHFVGRDIGKSERIAKKI
jgi:hypothetical protein